MDHYISDYQEKWQADKYFLAGRDLGLFNRILYNIEWKHESPSRQRQDITSQMESEPEIISVQKPAKNPVVDPKDLLGNRAWAPALYAEGWLTGVKDEDSGLLDYILSCFIPSTELSDVLFEAYESLTNGDQMQGYKLLEKSKPLFETSMT